jgi:hypothetical protein
MISAKDMQGGFGSIMIVSSFLLVLPRWFVQLASLSLRWNSSVILVKYKAQDLEQSSVEHHDLYCTNLGYRRECQGSKRVDLHLCRINVVSQPT